MMNIGFKLEQIRKSQNLTRKEVACKLKEYGIDISDKTLYGYETGRTSANADMFLALCDIYRIKDIQETFNSETIPSDGLTPTERRLLAYFRLLDKYGLESVLETAEREMRRCNAQGAINAREHNEKEN